MPRRRPVAKVPDAQWKPPSKLVKPRGKQPGKETDADGLTWRERMFVTAYLATNDEARAAIAMGFDRKDAKAQGYAIISKSCVGAAILKERDRILNKYRVETEDLVRELAKIAKANMADYMVRPQEGDRKPYIDLTDVTYEEMAGLGEVVIKETVLTTSYTDNEKGGDTETKRQVVEVETKIKLKDKFAALKYLHESKRQGDPAAPRRIIVEGGLPSEAPTDMPDDAF